MRPVPDCPKCGAAKVQVPDANRSSGFRARCRPCHVAASMERNRATPKRYAATNAAREKRRWQEIKADPERLALKRKRALETYYRRKARRAGHAHL